MLTCPSFRETLRYVALRVRRIKSGIVHCLASKPLRTIAYENLAAVRDQLRAAEHLTTPPKLNLHNR